MRKLLREPLFHFLLLGALIFAAYRLTSKRESPPQQITVTQGRIETMATTFLRTWQRPPTEAELQALIRDFVREEVCAREAMAIGLDKDDTIIRRRLRQKLEFICEDLTAGAEPTDEQLQRYMGEHPEAFRTGSRFTFTQVYLNPQQRADNLSRDTAQLLTHLQQAGAAIDASKLGDSLLLEPSFDSIPAGDIARQFGDKFAARLSNLPIGQWQGPIESGFGVHLVKIDQRSEGRLPPLNEVRNVVRREWAGAQRLEATERFHQELLKRYIVTIEQPPAPKVEQKLIAEARR